MKVKTYNNKFINKKKTKKGKNNKFEYLKFIINIQFAFKKFNK